MDLRGRYIIVCATGFAAPSWIDDDQPSRREPNAADGHMSVPPASHRRSAARRCVDDGAALRVVRVLNGVGPALGSAALMAMDASRWTVLDVRAVASIRAVGYSDVPDRAQRGSTWLPYLDACRDLAQRTSSALRTVDRALFAAKRP